MVEEPNLVEKLKEIITDGYKEYKRNKRTLVGKVEVESGLVNDEDSCPIISPQFYEEFCFPDVDDLARFYDKIRW